MAGTDKHSGSALSTGTMATGIMSVAAWYLELNALEDALEDNLDLVSILASNSSRVARFSS